MRRLPHAVLGAALVWIAALVQRGLPLGWDEVEFFRATRWIAEGKVPFRDFWEHHTPLQWILFAPVAWFADGPGAESIVLLRWAQVPLWIGIFAALFALAKELDARARWIALALLLASPSFVNKAVEYRVDVPGNLGYVAAVWLIGRRHDRAAWIAFGALMSAAVLSNMRLAPLVVATAAVAMFWREHRWRFQPQALWMALGVVAVAAVFVVGIYATGAMPQFLDGIFRYNVDPGREALKVATFGVTWLAPVWSLDAAGIAFWLLGLAGLVIAARGWRSPGPMQFVAVLFVLSMLAVRVLEVHYEYHFQNPYLLLLPLVAAGVARMRELWRTLAVGVAAVAVVVNVASLLPAFGREMDYQDTIMTEADRLTRPGEKVFDGVGYALRRPPAYRYWFLPTGLRMMAAEKLVEPYGLEQMAADPPAAIIFDFRVFRWFEIEPRLARYAVGHYVPMYRNLWVPGMTALVGPQPTRVGWIAPRAGRYDIWSSELLAKHPWLTRPMEYVTVRGARAAQYAIPLERLPALAPDDLEWRVDGVQQPRGVRSLVLRKGSRVELVARPDRAAGVLLVPHGVTEVCVGPAEEFVF